MRSAALLYHDVLPEGTPLNDSGFPSPARYKLRLPHFQDHMGRIAEIRHSTSTATEDVGSEPPPLLLTFDDGGSSAFTVIAPAIEQRGWLGHFFIATDFINQPGFMTDRQIRELHARGHVIGSHSASHPLRMSSLSDGDLRNEWRKSTLVLDDLLGKRTTVASVPGGGYSKRVAVAAAASGIKVLFTSEPVSRPIVIDGCSVIGRYSILDSTTAENAAQLAGLKTLPRLRQFVWWNAKKMMKITLGERYLSLREAFTRKDSH